MKKSKAVESVNIIERNIVINGTHIRLTSVFSNKIPLEKALANIAKRKMESTDMTTGGDCNSLGDMV